MARSPASSLRSKARLVAFLAAALLLRLLVPVGYMVGTAGGAPALVPCPQAVAAPMKMGGHGHHHGPGSHAEAPCPFAALSAPVLPPTGPVSAEAPTQRYALTPEPADTAAISPPAAAPPPPVRGPPAAV